MLPFWSDGTVSRLVSPAGKAEFTWPGSEGSFLLTMSLSSYPSATGSFKFTDIDNDTLEGTVSGVWVRVPLSGGLGYNMFGGVLSGVTFSQDGDSDGMFNGDSGSVLLSFPEYATSWNGSMTVLTGLSPSFDGTWTGKYFWGVDGGTVGGVVSAVPVPAGVLLGFLGLGAAGLGLRKLS